MLAMAQQLLRQGADFTLCVFARSREHLAFGQALADPALAPHVRLHFDSAADDQKIDLAQLLAVRAPGCHMYMCGPEGFMGAVQAASQRMARWLRGIWSTSQRPRGPVTAALPNEAFTLVLARRGVSVAVPPDQTAAQALHDLELDVPTSARRKGICGTCVVGYAGDGEPGAPGFLPVGDGAQIQDRAVLLAREIRPHHDRPVVPGLW